MAASSTPSHHEDRDRTINYVEFIVSDMARTKAFYAQAFGWTFTDYGPQYCEFSDSQMKGGFEVGTPKPQGGPLIVLYGEDLDSLQDAIKQSGGAISQETFSFPGGERFHFTDPDGYELAVWRHRDDAAV